MKLKFIAKFFILILSVVVFISCGESIELKGRYFLHHNLESHVYQFYDDGNYEVYDLDIGNHLGECVSEGTWELSGNKLTLTNGGGTRVLKLKHKETKHKDQQAYIISGDMNNAILRKVSGTIKNPNTGELTLF